MTQTHIQTGFFVSSSKTSHGKGPVDGLGAIVKNATRRETMQTDGSKKSLLTSVEFYNFLKQKFCPKSTNATTNTSYTATEKIQTWYLSESDINEHFDKHLSDRFKTRSTVGPIFGK